MKCNANHSAPPVCAFNEEVRALQHADGIARYEPPRGRGEDESMMMMTMAVVVVVVVMVMVMVMVMKAGASRELRDWLRKKSPRRWVVMAHHMSGFSSRKCRAE